MKSLIVILKILPVILFGGPKAAILSFKRLQKDAFEPEKLHRKPPLKCTYTSLIFAASNEG
jgi:hypothetical protein